MVQDITIAILFETAVVLPPYISSRKNCTFSDVRCSGEFITAPLWDVFDKERTLARLSMLGVKIVSSVGQTPNATHLFRSEEWPFAITQLLQRKPAIQMRCQRNFTLCILGDDNCCNRLVPNTKDSVRILKEVNRAFRSAWKFKVEAAKVINAFKKKTQQQPVVTMHWRLDEDFVQSKDHHLSSSTYCKGMLEALNRTGKILKQQRDQTTSSNTAIHILVLGAFDVTKVKTFFDKCGEDTRMRTFEFHSKETLIPRSES